MEVKKGRISVSTENIFPIIRQWLYSEQDIFIRELVSNAADAIAKLKRLRELGEAEQDGEYAPKVTVTLDTEKGILSIEDNGLGMTMDEVDKYINQIAYSGIVDFVERYQEQGNAGIIGHFGLGFYSAFMVADRVEIESLSWQPGSQAVLWSSEEGIEFEMKQSEKSTVGTVIRLHLGDSAKETYNDIKIRQVLRAYCQFMAVPIFVGDDEQPLNNPDPLWLRPAREISADEYKTFYRETFSDYRDPLFWVHLNMDYPFRLKGILYFPQTDNVYESLEGRIKIYYNQVFVADNIKEIIPEFLFLLRGCLDCPDLPLNVSRSFLQNDEYVTKLSAHIVRKVADRLLQVCQTEREDYNTYWRDIGVFVKYGMMQDAKFFERVRPALIFPTTTDDFLTLEELGINPETDKPDPSERTEPFIAFYTPDSTSFAPYIEMASRRGDHVLIMDHEIDNQFMSFLEYTLQGKIRFKRVDAELGGEAADGSLDQDVLSELFSEVLADIAPHVQISLQALGEDALPALIHE